MFFYSLTVPFLEFFSFHLSFWINEITNETFNDKVKLGTGRLRGYFPENETFRFENFFSSYHNTASILSILFFDLQFYPTCTLLWHMKIPLSLYTKTINLVNVLQHALSQTNPKCLITFSLRLISPTWYLIRLTFPCDYYFLFLVQKKLIYFLFVCYPGRITWWQMENRCTCKQLLN